MAENAKLVLWQNVQALMSRAYGGESLGRFAADCGIGAATMTRIKKHKTSVGIDVLEQIGRRFKLEPWQLLAPELGERAGVDPAAVRPALDILRAALQSREDPTVTLVQRPRNPPKPPSKKGEG